jgi:hypothetical protein
MFVTNHVLAGAIIGRWYADRPVTAFLIGAGSHLAMDSVPHWGCDAEAPGGPERFLRAARRDGVVGLAAAGGAVLAADRECRVSTMAAICGSVLLDLDKPVEHFFDISPFPAVVQWIHGAIQRESEGGMPMEVATGVLLAVADAWMARRSRRRGWTDRRGWTGRRGRTGAGRHHLATQCSCTGQSPATLPS